VSSVVCRASVIGVEETLICPQDRVVVCVERAEREKRADGHANGWEERGRWEGRAVRCGCAAW